MNLSLCEDGRWVLARDGDGVVWFGFIPPLGELYWRDGLTEGLSPEARLRIVAEMYRLRYAYIEINYPLLFTRFGDERSGANCD